jgi:hypothetical protein
VVNGRARQFVSACARDFGKQGFGEWKGASDTKEIVVDTNRGPLQHALPDRCQDINGCRGEFATHTGT